jgi:energy-coupling factor transporter ATP-binding protein EcfA2
MSKSSQPVVYAAAQGREFLRNALKGKENEYIHEFAGLIDDAETLDLLNYYCSLWADRGENFLDSRLAEIVIQSAATRTTDRAYREGNVSQLQGMVGLTNRQEDGKDAILRAAKLLADEGAIYLVLGPPGAGKTAFALDVSRAWAAVTGGTILANLAWDGADHTVTDSEDMLERMSSTPGQVLQLIDEAGQSLTSRGAEQAITNEFVKDLKYVRKQLEGDEFPKRGSVLLVGHTEKGTAAEIRRLASGAFVKPARGEPGRVIFKESEGGVDGFEQVAEYRGVTDTRERFDEHEASSFRVVQDDDEEADAIDPDAVRRDEAVRTALRAVKPWSDEDGMSQADAAELVEYSGSWVGDRVREWRRGEHRELVAAPEGGSG